MSKYLPLLFILACPLMMIFMMRGLHGGPKMGGGDQGPRHDEQPTRNHLDVVRADERVIGLEPQVAELRSDRDDPEGNSCACDIAVEADRIVG